MEDTFDVRWRNHAMEACGEVSRMRREETFADVVLCTDEQVFKVHRVILAACSSYFERIFTRMGDGKYTPFVVLRETDACLLKLVVDFIYDGHVRVPCDKLPGFMALAQGLEVRGLMGIPFEVCVEDGEDEPVPVRAKKRRSRDESPTDVKPMSNKVVNKVAVNDPGQDFGEANGSAGEEEQMVDDYQEFKFEMDEEPFNGEAGDQDFPESAEECGENQEKLENNLEVLESSVDLDQRTFPQPVAIGDIPRNIPPEISPTGLVRLTAYILRGKGPDGLPVSFCAVCGYMSPSAQNAIRHERIHTGERPFQCHLCNRRFSQSSNYRRHLISIHSTSPE